MPHALAYDPSEGSPTVAALQRAWGSDFDPAIHRDDSMFRHAVDRRQGSRELALFEYFRSGREAATSSLRILHDRFGRDLSGRRILELGCGFGRVTRFLRPHLDGAELLGSELEPGALEFRAERFDAGPGIDSRRPADLAAHAGRFDAVLAHSVLSHLPPSSFDAWLAALLESLTPEGLLLFSVHSPDDRPADLRSVEPGFAFVPSSESTVLPGEVYGTSWIDPRRVATRVPPDARHRWVPRGLWRLQDLHVVARGSADLADPDRHLLRPEGVLDACRLEGAGRLALEGWALATDPSSERPEIEIRLDGTPRWSGRPDGPRSDVTDPRELPPSTPVAFRVAIEDSPERLGSRSILEVEARDAGGATLLHCGPIDATTLWLRAADLESRLRREQNALRSWEEGRWGALRRFARRWTGRTP